MEKGSVKDILNNRSSVLYQYSVFVKWLFISVICGIFIGFAGAGFHILLDKVTELRTEHGVIMLLLPLGGLIIVGSYALFKMTGDGGTNGIMRGARGEEKVSIKTAPLIVVATLLTHLMGGSAGREGAALQLGGSLISPVNKLLKLDEEEYATLIMCGMAAGFAALFGTPAASAIFAIEVTVVGITQYSAIVPCILSSVTAAMTARLIGVHPTSFTVAEVPVFGEGSLSVIFRVVLLGILCALVSMLFCFVMEETAEAYKEYIKNPYLRVVVGGVIVILMSQLIYLFTGAFDYNGAGTYVIERALLGECSPEAFILKIIMTALTLGAGYKGGEIVPTMFIGATFGCLAGGLIGLPPSFGAAVGLAAVFCGVTNCPLASVVLSVELFGKDGLPYYFIAIALSYMLSGYTGLYSAQKFYANKPIHPKFEGISSYEEIVSENVPVPRSRPAVSEPAKKPASAKKKKSKRKGKGRR